MISVWQIFIFSMIAFSVNFNNGFSSTYLNTPVDQFKDFINESFTRKGRSMTDSTYNNTWNLIINIAFVGFFVGIWFSPFFNDRFGRKVGFLIGASGAFLAALLRFLAVVLYEPLLLFFGNLFSSISIGISYQSCILYLQACSNEFPSKIEGFQESSPTHLRGTISFLNEISFALMCVIGTLLGTPQILGNHLAIFLGFPVPFYNIIQGAVFVVFLLFIPETPKFLLLISQNEEAAKKSVHFFHGNDADAEKVLTEFRLEAKGHEEKASVLVLMRELVKEVHLQKALLLGFCALQNTVPLWPLLVLSTYFLEDVNVATSLAAWSTTVMTVAYMLGTLIGSTLIDRIGRRPLLLIFVCLNNATLLLYIVCSELHSYADGFKYVCLVSLIAYGFTYGSGLGPIAEFISSELVPLRHRSLIQSICFALNTVVVVVTTFSLLPLYGIIGSYALLILYSIPSLIGVIFLFKFLPETKGKEIHSIVAELSKETSSNAK